MNEQDRLADQICETGIRLYEQGFIAATEGNLSCRLGDDRVLCTPTMVGKADLARGDLCVVDLHGRQLAGSRSPTSEIQLHLAIYRSSPNTRAVVHCHPPHATAFAISRTPLPAGLLAEAEYYLGEIPTIDYRTPGTTELADLITPHAAARRAAILKNHGAVTWDATVERARWWMEVLEAYCRVLILARTLGEYARLDDVAIRKLRELGGKL